MIPVYSATVAGLRNYIAVFADVVPAPGISGRFHAPQQAVAQLRLHVQEAADQTDMGAPLHYAYGDGVGSAVPGKYGRTWGTTTFLASGLYGRSEASRP